MSLEQLVSDFWEVVLMVGIGTGISLVIAGMIFVPLFLWANRRETT